MILLLIAVVLLITVAVLFLNRDRWLLGFWGVTNPDVPIAQKTISSIPYNISPSSGFVVYKDSVLMYGKEGIKSINAKGKVEWQINNAMNAPFVSVNGDYILLADSGGKKIYIYKRDKLVQEAVMPYSVLNAKAGNSGNFVALLDEPYYHAMVTVRSAANEELFLYHLGSAYAIDADISKDGKRVVIATMDEKNNLRSGVLIFDIAQGSPRKTHSFEDVVLANVYYNTDNTVFVVADNKVMGLNVDGDVGWTYDYGGKTLKRAIEGENCITINLSGSGDSGSRVCQLASSGVEKLMLPIEYDCKFVGAVEKRLAHGHLGNVLVYDDTGRKLYTIASANHIRDIVIFNGGRRALCIGNTVVEVIELR